MSLSAFVLGRRTPTVVAVCVFAIGVIYPEPVVAEQRDGSTKCWISPLLTCNAAEPFPSVQELRFISYLPTDSYPEEEMQGAGECTCFRGTQLASRVVLAMRPSNQTVEDASLVLQKLAAYINVSTVTALWLEGTGIFTVKRHFFNGFTRLSQLTITNTSNGEGFVFDMEPILHSLADFDLTNNSFAYASEDFIHNLEKLADKSASVYLAGNPFECDCLLKPLYDWLQNGSGGKLVADKSALACNNLGRPILSCRREDLECKEINVANHLEAAYAIMSTSLAVVIIILLLVMWRKGSTYLSACLSSRRSNYTAVHV